VEGRRSAIEDAAITTIAKEGMRGLTHRAVDRTAGLAEGSTSYYFRTREALIFGAVTRMAELDRRDIGELPAIDSSVGLDTLTTLMTSVVVLWLGPERNRSLARYELTLESTRRPELRQHMRRFGLTFRLMAEKLLADAGASEPGRQSRALVSYVDGLMIHQLTQVGSGVLSEEELRAACRDLLVMALS
jgi:DNA-binding transcriptional regulator YbjK